VAAQAVGLDPCLLRTPGKTPLGKSEAKLSDTRPEREPNGCSRPQYKTKRDSRLISMVNCGRVARKVN